MDWQNFGERLPVFGWVPEQDFPQSYRALKDWSPDDETESSNQPILVEWQDFKDIVQKKKAVKDSLRKQGYNFFPWKIAEKIGAPFSDPNQGSLGSCAGFAAIDAANAIDLIQIADGYNYQHREYNPYPTWKLGRRDAGYNGGGATISMVLNSANKYGLFTNENYKSYSESLSGRFEITEQNYADAEKRQIGACYLGDYRGEELARIVFDCLAAGFTAAVGTSTAVSSSVSYRNGIKILKNSGSWMHATARIAYRKEADGTEYIAHQNSWGKWLEQGPEKEPASVGWEDFETFARQCSGRYIDCFIITRVENIFQKSEKFSFELI